MNNVNDESIRDLLSALADDELNNNDAEDAIGLACQDQEARSAWLSTHLVRDVLQADYNAALPLDFAARVSASIDREQTFANDQIAASVAAPVASMADARGRREQRIRGAQPVKHRQTNGGHASVQSTQQQPFSLWKPVAGLGLAASLAGATFLVPQLWQSETGNAGQLAQVGQDQVGQQIDETAVTAPNTSIIAATETDQQIDDHALQAAVRKGNGGTRWRMDNKVPRNGEIEKRLNTLLTNHLENASMGGVHGLVSHSRVVGYDSAPSEQSESE